MLKILDVLEKTKKMQPKHMRIEAATKEPMQLKLPPWSDSFRGVPNSILRSALFAAIQGKNRKNMFRESLASLDGIKIKFSGQQLDQSDMDVWETMVHFCREQNVGSRIRFSAYSALKSMQRDTGKAQHEWLYNSFVRLSGAALEIELKGNKSFFGAMLKGIKDDVTNEYHIELDPLILALYSTNDWTKIQWEKRVLLKRKPLALWLHSFYSSHSFSPYPIKLETIMHLCGSTNKSPSDFKRKLEAALSDMEKAGCIEKWQIKGELVIINGNGIRAIG